MKNLRNHKYEERFMKAITSVILGLLIATGCFYALVPVFANADGVNVWWPNNGAHMTSTQPFKAMVSGLDVTQYIMFWQVDGGQWNLMDNNFTNYPHKQADVNVSGWNWRGSGPYVVNFIASENGVIIGQQSETIYVDNNLPSGALTTQTVSVVAPTQVIASNAVASPVAASPSSSVSSPSNGTGFYVNPNSDAMKALQSATDSTTKSALTLLASQPTASWFGDWNSNVQNDAANLMSASRSQGKTPIIVTYNIPERDCGGFSSGGSNNPSGYTSWINSLSAGIGNNPVIVILEPDSLAQIGCLSQKDQQTRYSLLSSAVSTLKKNPNAKVYIDAGHSNWIATPTMANELSKANVSQADGFSLDVSNFMTTGDEANYGTALSSLTGGKHFLIDTSRNGNGSDGNWCNPSGRAIGIKPTTQTGNSLIDAYLWVKVPGESDGNCNGGPGAGTWWTQYAVGLVSNAR